MVVYDAISERVGMELTAIRILPFVIPLLLEPQLGAQQVLVSLLPPYLLSWWWWWWWWRSQEEESLEANCIFICIYLFSYLPCGSLLGLFGRSRKTTSAIWCSSLTTRGAARVCYRTYQGHARAH
jgi:hypothetical protein